MGVVGGNRDEAVHKVPNTVYSWNARQAAVQRPHSEATVLTFFVFGTTPQSHGEAGRELPQQTVHPSIPSCTTKSKDTGV